MLDLVEAGNSEDRGFIEETSADIIRESIISDYMSMFIARLEILS